MNFSIKNTLSLWILFFSCSFLHGAENVEEDLYVTTENPQHSECEFYDKEDCIKVKIVLSVGRIANSELYKINNPDSKDSAFKIKNHQLECLKTFFQLADIEVYASQEEGGVTFKIIENLERKPTSGKTLKDTLELSQKYFIKTDKQVDFNVTPKLTVSRNSPQIKYLRFFTKP